MSTRDVRALQLPICPAHAVISVLIPHSRSFGQSKWTLVFSLNTIFFSFCELKLKDPTCFLYSNVCNMSGVLSCVLNPLETDHTVWRCTSVTGSTIKCSLSLVFSLQVFLHWLA